MKKNLFVKVLVFLVCVTCARIPFGISLAEAADPFDTAETPHLYRMDHVSQAGLPDPVGPKQAGPQWFATTMTWNDQANTADAWACTIGGIALGDFTNNVNAPFNWKMMNINAALLCDYEPAHIHGEDYHAHINNGNDPAYDDNTHVLGSAFLVIEKGRGDLAVNFDGESVYEDVRLVIDDDEYSFYDEANDGYDDYYAPSINAAKLPANALTTMKMFEFDLNSNTDAYEYDFAEWKYGSYPGWMIFFDAADSADHEALRVPLVVANVSEGRANQANPLLFDLLIYDTDADGNGDILSREVVRWDATADAINDMGNFFMIQPRGSANARTYGLTARVTNRSGVRYYNQRYDELPEAKRPDYWAYDLPTDFYSDLPASFQLDWHSQIAPGLVTAYGLNMSMSSEYASNLDEQFRVYTYDTSPLRNISFRHSSQLGRGMEFYGPKVSQNGNEILGNTPPLWTVGAFNMAFRDIDNNSMHTETEISNLIGGTPKQIPVAEGDAGLVLSVPSWSLGDGFNSFEFQASVPTGLISDDVKEKALLPLQVRLRISRDDITRNDPNFRVWKELLEAEARGKDYLMAKLPEVCKIKLYSDYATKEHYLDLFACIGNVRGYKVAECFQAFTYDHFDENPHNDFLYIDFIMLLADGVRQEDGYSASCYVVEDYGVPYILVGDGRSAAQETDGVWGMKFTVEASASDYDPLVVGAGGGFDNNSPSGGNNSASSSENGGGGGCSAGGLGMATLLCLAFYAGFKLLKKTR